MGTQLGMVAPQFAPQFAPQSRFSGEAPSRLPSSDVFCPWPPELAAGEFRYRAPSYLETLLGDG